MPRRVGQPGIRAWLSGDAIVRSKTIHRGFAQRSPVSGRIQLAFIGTCLEVRETMFRARSLETVENRDISGGSTEDSPTFSRKITGD
jgi:hypothetical protein